MVHGTFIWSQVDKPRASCSRMASNIFEKKTGFQLRMKVWVCGGIFRPQTVVRDYARRARDRSQQRRWYGVPQAQPIMPAVNTAHVLPTEPVRQTLSRPSMLT